MIEKYNFDKKDIEKVLVFFEPALHTINVMLNEHKKILTEANLLSKEFNYLFNYFKNLKFLDEFEEGRKIIADYYQSFLNNLIFWNKNFVADRHTLMPELIWFYEISLLVNSWINLSYQNVKNKKNVISISYAIDDIKNIISSYIKEVFNIKNAKYFNKQIFDLFKNIKNEIDFKKIEKNIDLILFILEEINSEYDEINNIFDSYSQDYWKIFNTINKISILSSFALFLKEQDSKI